MTTTTTPSIDVPLDQLRANADFQPRVELPDTQPFNEKHVKQLMASNAEVWPPLLVTPNNVGGYDVVSGFHRLEAAKRLGLQALQCIVQLDAGYPEAFTANMGHGLPLTTEDRKAYARWLHEQEPTLSYRELGRRCGLNHHTIKKAITGGQDAHSGNGSPSASNSQQPQPLEKLIHLTWQAIQEGAGENRLAQFFSRKTSRQQRAQYIASMLANVENDNQQREVAAALHAFSLALYDGTQPFLSK